MTHVTPRFIALLALLSLHPLAARGDDVEPGDFDTATLEAAGDGFPIHITYYPVTEEMYPAGDLDSAPVVVMLHGTDGSRLFWDRASRPNTATGKPFAEAVNAQGFAVITVDLRLHGDSVVEGLEQTVRPVDYPKMVAGDMVAVKKFIFDEHQAHRLNMNKMGIIAMEMSAPLALAFAEEDWQTLPHRDGPGGGFGTPRGQDVRSLVLISPDASAGTLTGNRSIAFLKDPAFGISFMFIAGAEDEEDDGLAAEMHEAVSRQNEERAVLLEPMIGARGQDLFLNNSARIEPAILTFLTEHLKTVDSQWIDRRSRYERDEEDE